MKTKIVMKISDWASQIKSIYIWDKVFESGLSKFCGRQSLKNFEGYGLLNIKGKTNVFQDARQDN